MKVISSTALKKPRWPWPKMNTNEVAERSLENEIFMPNIGYVNIGDTKEWQAELGNAANSKKLWINSLVTPHACLVESVSKGDREYFEKSVELITSYLTQYDSGQGLFDIAWRDEHAVSNRLFVLCAFIHYLASVEETSISQLALLYHAERHAQWLSNDDHYINNNHGVMMDLSLAQFALMISQVDRGKSFHYIEHAANRLNMMFNKTFDSKGCCTENSPTYHFVNYSLFSSILSLFQEYKIAHRLDGWEEMLEKAKEVGFLFLRPDGTIPLIGDSEAKQGIFIPKIDESRKACVGFFPESGFFIFSKDKVHFTMRSGGESYSHRHIDDLSITLWFGGEEFIVDSGLYNYDISDKLRRRFISTMSHSGFYLESQGQVLFKNFKTPQEMSKFTNFKEVNDGFCVQGVHELSPAAKVVRDLKVNSDNILIHDSFESKELENWRYQLVLHPDVEVDFESRNKAILSNGDSNVIWYFDDDSDDKDIVIKLEKGYYSPSFMRKRECRVIVVSGKSYGVNFKSGLLLT